MLQEYVARQILALVHIGKSDCGASGADLRREEADKFGGFVSLERQSVK